MSIQIATSAVWGLGFQTAYGVVQPTEANYKYYAFTGLAYGPMQPVANLPLEAGQSIMTRSTYKTGFWGAGAVNLLPRLDANIGYLLAAACGVDSYTAANDFAGAQAGVSLHEFAFDPTNEAFLPYFTVRRKLPHSDTTKILGEVIPDNHINNMELSIPATGPVTATMDMVGRKPAFDDQPLWDAPTYDDDDAYALAVHESSTISVDGTPLKCTGATITLSNNLLTPDQARVIGDPTPVDYPCLSRAASIRVTAFVEDYDWYLKTFTGLPLGGALPWTSTVFRGNFDIKAFSPIKIGATDSFMGLQFRNGAAGTEDNVAWGLQGALDVRPGQPLMITLLGIIERSAGVVPFKIRVQNGAAAEYPALV